MDINNVINEMAAKKIFEIKLFNVTIPITDSIIIMWLISIIIILLSIMFTYKMKIIPNKKQNIIESIIEFISKMCDDSIGEKGYMFISFIGTMFLFLAISNIIDIINTIFFKYSIVPPTKDLSVVIGLAFISICSVIFAGIHFKKFKGWFKSFFEPIPIIFPFKVLDYLMKPISLTLRLFGNVSVSFLIMTLIVGSIPLILPGVLSLYFDIFDGLLQAYIFIFLTSLYIGEAIED